MATQSAVFTVAPGAPLEARQVPTPTPGPGEVLIHSQWTASTPFDLHIADGWLGVNEPQITGGGFAGPVVSVHPSVTNLKPGDLVFGFTFGEPTRNTHQTYTSMPAWLCGKIPSNITIQEASTVPANLVTIFQAAHANLDLELPWPKPENFVPKHANSPILIWGGSSSVGQYALQVFKYYGYNNLLATASSRHHSLVKSLGATQVFDYRDPEVTTHILSAASGRVPFIFDCVGHATGTIEPISRIAQAGDRVGVVLPVIIVDAAEGVKPQFEMEPKNIGSWKEGVLVTGIRAHSYPQNGFFKEKMQPEIVPRLLELGVVKPNSQRLVEGKTMLERAQTALDILRRKEQSAEKLVWRVSDE